jgi:MSHA biogenesis protein MshJ
MNALKLRWQAWAMRLDAMSFRERALVFLAVAGVALTLMFVGLIEPELKRQEITLQTASSLQQEIFGLREQLTSSEQLDQHGHDSELKRLQDEAAVIKRTVKMRESGLIPPERMLAVLKSMLAQQPGLSLLSVTTVPAQPAIPLPADAPESPVPPADSFYKHGITLSVSGNYAGLTEYLARLERMAWTVQWESVEIDARQHPRLVMTLKLNTLSREPTWARL